MREISTLDGLWRFKAGQDGEGFLPTISDQRWAEIPVPSHWHHAGYPYYAGDAWYRTRFATPQLAVGERCVLHFDAVDYLARVWLNGVCLGEHEGYFAPFAFDITPHLSARGENLLAVHVANPADDNDLVKGAILRWDCKDPKANPGGIWQSVHLLASAPTEIGHVRTQTTVLPGGLPILHLQVRVFHRGEPVAAHLHVGLRPLNFAGRDFSFEKKVGLFAGEQELAFDFELPGAELWWPWDWGHPALYELALDLANARSGASLAALSQRCGLRQVTRGDQWAIYLNGQQIFLRGSNYLSDGFMSTMTAERYRHDIALAQQANLNALLPFGNVERREFYDLCDEQGMLITQYLSMQYRYRADRSFLRRAEQVLAETVALLDPHPSVITWIMNGEPDLDTHLALDRPLAERCRTLDPSRPVQVSSFPIMPLEYGSEDRAMHDWLAKFCHYTGAIYRDLGATGSHSLVAEFGQQSLPSLEALYELGIRQAWPPDWGIIQEHNGCPDELCLYEHERPPAQTIEELIEVTQCYQGEVIRYYIDHLRCHRDDWCHALFQFHLVDSWPAVTWSVADYARRPKASYGYLQEAFEPFTLVPDCPPVFCLPGETLEVPLYAINDGPRPVQGQAHVALYDSAQRRLLARTHNIEVDANSSRWVDTLQWQVPEDAQDEIHSLHLALKTVEGRLLARRPYRILVRSSYAIPLADPALTRADWSWHRHEEGDAWVTYERESDRCFARLRSGRDGFCWILNPTPVHSVPVGETLQLVLSARASAASGSVCELLVGLEAMSPIEQHHYHEPISHGLAGSACRLQLPADGAWHQLKGELSVPECPQGQELHLRCSCPKGCEASVDVTGFALQRGTT